MPPPPLSALRARFHATAGGLPATFWTLWWGLLVNRLGTFVAAFLAPYLVQVRGLDAATAGRIVALFGVGVMVAGPLGGTLADRIGRKATMMTALLVGAAAVGSILLVRSAAALGFVVFLSGATSDMYRPAFSAAVADVVPHADRARAYGLVYWGVNLALAIGMLVGGAVAAQGMSALFVADACTSLACAVLVAVRVPETRPAGVVATPVLRGMAEVLRDGPFVTFAALHLAALLVFGQWQMGLPLDMARQGLGPSAFATLMAMNCAGVVVLQPILSPRLARLDGARLLATMGLLFGLGYGVNALGAGLPGYAVGTTLWTFGEVIGFPVASTIVADLAPPALRGRYQGVFGVTVGLSFTLAPLLGGEIYGRLGGRTLWLACLAVGVLVALGQLAAAPARRRRLAVIAEAGAADRRRAS